MSELTEEQIKAEQKMMEGVPRVNLGALFMPGLWGPANGLWVAILFYPLWLFADNVFYSAFSERTATSIVVAVIVFVILVAVSVAFAILGQPYALHRALKLGVSKEKYLKRQKIWTPVCLAIAIVLLGWATYYNLTIRPTLG